MIYFACPQCDSEVVAPHRKHAKRVRASMARMYVCRNCKHRFIVVSFIARGKLAEVMEEAIQDVH